MDGIWTPESSSLSELEGRPGVARSSFGLDCLLVSSCLRVESFHSRGSQE